VNGEKREVNRKGQITTGGQVYADFVVEYRYLHGVGLGSPEAAINHFNF
jgi:hypothetical protein